MVTTQQQQTNRQRMRIILKGFDHNSHSFYNVTSIEAFAKILDNPFAREWDKANNCKDIVYRLEGPL